MAVVLAAVTPEAWPCSRDPHPAGLVLAVEQERVPPILRFQVLAAGAAAQAAPDRMGRTRPVEAVAQDMRRRSPAC